MTPPHTDPAALRDLVPDWMQSASIPICTEHKGNLCGLSTGFVFSIRDHLFLTTAAHSIQTAKKHDLSLSVPCPWDPLNSLLTNLVPLPSEWHIAEKPDIAVCPLKPSPHFDELRTLTSVQPEQVDTRPAKNLCLCCLIGFPGLWCAPGQTGLSQKSILYFTQQYLGDQLPVGYDSSLHLLFNGDHDGGINDQGQPEAFLDLAGNNKASFPRDLVGISGCPIFRVATPREDRTWERCEPALVAIEHGVYSNGIRLIRGTNCLAYFEFLSDLAENDLV